MKRAFRWLMIAATCFAGGMILKPATCVAGWCPTYKCFGPCGGSCRCLSRDYGGGTCVDIQAVPELLERGWVELP